MGSETLSKVNNWNPRDRFSYLLQWFAIAAHLCAGVTLHSSPQSVAVNLITSSRILSVRYVFPIIAHSCELHTWLRCWAGLYPSRLRISDLRTGHTIAVFGMI